VTDQAAKLVLVLVVATAQEIWGHGKVERG
jgi:hypothetical protein